MKKMQIILLAAAGLSSFAAAFGTSWYLNKKKAAQLAEKATLDVSAQNATVASAGSASDFVLANAASGESAQTALSERQLQTLIQEIRGRLKDYQDRQQQLEAEADRIEISRQAMQQDIDKLNALRDKLNLTLADLQRQEVQLQQSILEITSLEKSNFQRLASYYEKMEVVQAGKIMVTMAASNQIQDSVKIIYYMTDRAAGKLLAEIATAKPELATVICSQLKRIKESG